MIGARQAVVVPQGWVARGFRFEVQPTTIGQSARIPQHFGARRFAYNWALAQVKANLDARAADPSVAPLAWNLPALRKQWNQAKDQVAPWWRDCSKEAYAAGIADLVAALHNWSDAKHGRRAGRRVGFPRFKARRRDRGRVRFTTGAMRLEPDRRHLVLPVIGRLRVAHPAPWAEIQQERRRLARQRARRIVGSRGHRQANAKLAALDRRAANLRTHHTHLLTTGLARRYGTIVVEDLDIAAMGRSMGRRVFRGCGGYLADLKLGRRVWRCPACGGLVDRNANAALNLRDWTGPAGAADRVVQRGGVAAPVPRVGDHGGQAHALRGACEALEDHREVAGADDTRTKPPAAAGARNPEQGYQPASTHRCSLNG